MEEKSTFGKGTNMAGGRISHFLFGKERLLFFRKLCYNERKRHGEERA